MQVIRRFALVGGVAFALNILWERTHLPLYSGYEALGSGWLLIFWASAGDVIYTVFIALAIAAWKRNLNWMDSASGREYAAAGLLGFLVALFVEYKALYLHRWSYAIGMPIIPVMGVGLSPLLQMMTLVPLSIWITKRLLYPTSDLLTDLSGHNS